MASQIVFLLLLLAGSASAKIADQSPTTIWAPVSTPAKQVFDLSIFVLLVTGCIFVAVFSLLVYAVARFRHRAGDDREPPQVYGSNQVELAWTVVPILIVVALFLTTTQVINSIQKAKQPDNAIEVIAVGHQFWWEYRYPQFNVVAANELHIPVSDRAHPTPTFIKLLSSDTDHSFWVPKLAGKTDLIPNHPNKMWFDPYEPGLYLGQCAQYCGTQHAKMLLRVYVEPRDQFDQWIQEQAKPLKRVGAPSQGQRIFEKTSCINCHAIAGTVADGRFGPNLTHLMSRDTLASGAVENTPENLRIWIQNPEIFKPGSKMPAMQLSDQELSAIVNYLETLH
jgi:cytochrome c oxidase subunit 2